MSGDKCNLCGMKVLNMEVHVKLNHKKRKSTKAEGFRFTGYGAVTSAPAPLPSITKYQKTQNTTTDKGGSKNTGKSDTEKECEGNKSGASCKAVSHIARNNQCLQERLVMLGNLMDQETAKTIYKLDDVTDSDMKDIFKSGSITKEGFELKLKLLGMIKIGNNYKKKDERYTKYCPDCGAAFHWDRGKQRGKNLEYFDHIKTCGIESNYSNKTQEVETQKEMAKPENVVQLEPEIDMCMKEEIEIKKEDPNDVYDPNVVVKTEPQSEGISNAKIAVKNEPSDTGDIDLEATYGEQLMLKKLQIKREPVESLEQVHIDMTDNLEGMTTAVKTEEESKDFETLSLELTIVSTEESFGNPLLDSVCLNDLGELFKDRNKLDIVASTEDDEKNVGEKSKESKSNTGNLGDAWFKKISEMERKKTQGQNIHENKGKIVKKRTNTVAEPVFKPNKRQRKKVVKSNIDKYLLQ